MIDKDFKIAHANIKTSLGNWIKCSTDIFIECYDEDDYSYMWEFVRMPDYDWAIFGTYKELEKILND